MLDVIEITVASELLVLHPYRAVYWPKNKSLMVTDLHLGKIQHFIKAGISLPSHASMDNFERLSSTLLQFQPERLLILGDLFHSDYNSDWRVFSELRQTFAAVQFDLILGNHDSLDSKLYADNKIDVYENLKIGPFLLTHKPLEGSADYNIAGHLHPGVKLYGQSRQSLTLPCFYFGNRQAILPAFGTFTGVYKLKPEKEDRVIVISSDHLIDVTPEEA
jgi:DNA ligase-associated metallophosphoesterase